MRIFRLAKPAKLTKLTSLALAALVPLSGIAIFFSPSVSASQIESSAYFHLRRGMSESEVLVRAGTPDLAKIVDLLLKLALWLAY